jgi:hypothetical protein
MSPGATSLRMSLYNTRERLQDKHLFFQSEPKCRKKNYEKGQTVDLQLLLNITFSP